jgi:hypothetical protein
MVRPKKLPRLRPPIQRSHPWAAGEQDRGPLWIVSMVPYKVKRNPGCAFPGFSTRVTLSVSLPLVVLRVSPSIAQISVSGLGYFTASGA